MFYSSHTYIEYNYFLLLLVTHWQRNTCTLPHTRTHTQSRASETTPSYASLSLSSPVQLWDMIRTLAECEDTSQQKDTTRSKTFKYKNIQIYYSLCYFHFTFFPLPRDKSTPQQKTKRKRKRKTTHPTMQ